MVINTPYPLKILILHNYALWQNSGDIIDFILLAPLLLFDFVFFFVILVVPWGKQTQLLVLWS